IRERINSFLQREYDSYGLADISPAHAGVLFAIGKDNPSMQDLAQKLERDNSTITALVAKLQHIGYVKKVRNTEDGRIWHVSLTSKGQEARKKTISISRRMLVQAYGGFSADEVQILSELLDKLYKNFE
ncbi:MAG: winged helix-turn-helix transcriptional regulator, partial [Leptospiraceae bacterium]|nr:winged helix-turn-helix transcriptional regulator [Leptospiraceae bacterium]